MANDNAKIRSNASAANKQYHKNRAREYNLRGMAQSGQLANLPVNPEGVVSMPAQRPEWSNWNGKPVQPVVDMNPLRAAADFFGPDPGSLEDAIYSRADNETARFYGSTAAATPGDYNREFNRAQAMYDFNENVMAGTRGEYYNPQASVKQDLTGIGMDPNGISNPQLKAYLTQKLRARQGGSQPPVPDNYTPRR